MSPGAWQANTMHVRAGLSHTCDEGWQPCLREIWLWGHSEDTALPTSQDRTPQRVCVARKTR